MARDKRAALVATGVAAAGVVVGGAFILNAGVASDQSTDSVVKSAAALDDAQQSDASASAGSVDVAAPSSVQTESSQSEPAGSGGPSIASAASGAPGPAASPSHTTGSSAETSSSSEPPGTAKSKAPAYLTVPAADISRLKIVRYSGDPDDRRGTQINDAGLAGAPHGTWGGVGPGEVGNLLLTAHRTSAGAPMRDVPELSRGDKIFVDQGAARYVYVVDTKTMINFRNASSRALQAAPVPGSPGKKASVASIVLSTCATPEDNAAGDYWRDQFDNPTHRIAVYGHLESVTSRR